MDCGGGPDSSSSLDEGEGESCNAFDCEQPTVFFDVYRKRVPHYGVPPSHALHGPSSHAQVGEGRQAQHTGHSAHVHVGVSHSGHHGDHHDAHHHPRGAAPPSPSSRHGSSGVRPR